jgi:hypothetical protein
LPIDGYLASRTIGDTLVAWNQPARSAIVSKSKAPCSWSIVQQSKPDASMIHGIPREANSLRPVPSAARPSRPANAAHFHRCLQARAKKFKYFCIDPGSADQTQSWQTSLIL